LPISPHDIPVLLVGESGTEKKYALRFIAFQSGPTDIREVRFAGLTAESLIARPEFWRRGTRDGGDGASGSLFLDEVGNLDVASQSRLLNSCPTARSWNAEPWFACGSSPDDGAASHEMRSGASARNFIIE